MSAVTENTKIGSEHNLFGIGSRLPGTSPDLTGRIGESIPKQHVRRLFCDCDDRRVGITADDGGHHGRIDYT
jgi:hypothetical protein